VTLWCVTVPQASAIIPATRWEPRVSLLSDRTRKGATGVAVGRQHKGWRFVYPRIPALVGLPRPLRWRPRGMCNRILRGVGCGFPSRINELRMQEANCRTPRRICAALEERIVNMAVRHIVADSMARNGA
jgi:hypothetical protein